MATIINNSTNGCRFRWRIENISHCFLKRRESIVSSCFIVDDLETTKWFLKLYPMGVLDEKEISLFLYRDEDCPGKDIIAVNYQLAFLDKDGLFLKEMHARNQSFVKGKNWGYIAFELREKVFDTERLSFIPDDTLTVQCTIWKKDDEFYVPKYSYARTVHKVNNGSFVWKIGEFSSLKTNTRYKFKADFIDFNLDLVDALHLTKKLDINIISFDTSVKYFSIKVFIINSDGDEEDCGAHEYFADGLKTGVLSMPTFSKMLSKNKLRYLPNDELTLYCEYVFSNGASTNEFCSSGIISSKISKVIEEKNEHFTDKENSQSLPNLVNDLKFLYNDRTLSDIELRTETQTFKAHRIILSARSPVFRRMFSNDMKENNSGHIDISDLENETVLRMLLYIYTDIVEDLELENGCKLYAAADKYDILSLKNRCSSFLKDNLCPANAYDVLTLADMHHDMDLKNAAQNYMLKHDKEVFGSQEWKDFMTSNIQLAADVMFKKVFPG